MDLVKTVLRHRGWSARREPKNTTSIETINARCRNSPEHNLPAINRLSTRQPERQPESAL
jgi:hypothetical protein